MKNPANYIKEQLNTLLKNSVVYLGETVPVYEGEGVHGAAFQILIMDRAGSLIKTKVSNESDIRQVLEIVSEGPSAGTKHVDKIANTVMGILKPQPWSMGLPDSADWQVTRFEITPPRYLTEESGKGSKIVRLILELQIRILQKQ